MTGVRVIATTMDMNSETMNDTPSGVSMRPSMPLRKNSGTKATTVIIVALITEERISLDASYTILRFGSRCSGGRR